MVVSHNIDKKEFIESSLFLDRFNLIELLMSEYENFNFLTSYKILCFFNYSLINYKNLEKSHIFYKILNSKFDNYQVNKRTLLINSLIFNSNISNILLNSSTFEKYLLLNFRIDTDLGLIGGINIEKGDTALIISLKTNNFNAFFDIIKLNPIIYYNDFKKIIFYLDDKTLLLFLSKYNIKKLKENEISSFCDLLEKCNFNLSRNYIKNFS